MYDGLPSPSSRGSALEVQILLSSGQTTANVAWQDLLSDAECPYNSGMEPNPYEAPGRAVKNVEPATRRREKLLKRLARTGLALFILSPFLYFGGIVLVFSADNMRPDRARPRARMGEVVWNNGVAAFWTGLGLMILPLCFPLPQSKT